MCFPQRDVIVFPSTEEQSVARHTTTQSRGRAVPLSRLGETRKPAPLLLSAEDVAKKAALAARKAGASQFVEDDAAALAAAAAAAEADPALMQYRDMLAWEVDDAEPDAGQMVALRKCVLSTSGVGAPWTPASLRSRCGAPHRAASLSASARCLDSSLSSVYSARVGPSTGRHPSTARAWTGR